MISSFKLLFLVISFTLLNSISFAEKKKECSHYTTKNFAGLSDYLRCKKGLPPLEKSFLKDLQWSKEKQSKRKRNFIDPFTGTATFKQFNTGLFTIALIQFC